MQKRAPTLSPRGRSFGAFQSRGLSRSQSAGEAALSLDPLRHSIALNRYAPERLATVHSEHIVHSGQIDVEPQPTVGHPGVRWGDFHEPNRGCSSSCLPGLSAPKPLACPKCCGRPAKQPRDRSSPRTVTGQITIALSTQQCAIPGAHGSPGSPGSDQCTPGTSIYELDSCSYALTVM